MEEEFYKVNSRVNAVLNRLQDEDNKLQRLLDEVEADGDDGPVIADPAKVERYLGELRDGKRKTIIAGMDEELDKAVRIYESEVRAIRDWAKEQEFPAGPPAQGPLRRSAWSITPRSGLKY